MENLDKCSIKFFYFIFMILPCKEINAQKNNGFISCEINVAQKLISNDSLEVVFTNNTNFDYILPIDFKNKNFYSQSYFPSILLINKENEFYFQNKVDPFYLNGDEQARPVFYKIYNSDIFKPLVEKMNFFILKKKSAAVIKIKFDLFRDLTKSYCNSFWSYFDTKKNKVDIIRYEDIKSGKLFLYYNVDKDWLHPETLKIIKEFEDEGYILPKEDIISNVVDYEIIEDHYHEMLINQTKHESLFTFTENLNEEEELEIYTNFCREFKKYQWILIPDKILDIKNNQN
jgi:hypothetical protein